MKSTMAGALMAITLTAGTAAAEPAATNSQLNVLFIGNSMTWFNNMPRMVCELAWEMKPPATISAVKATYSCATLAKTHTPEGSGARKAIAAGGSGTAGNPDAEMKWAKVEALQAPEDSQTRKDLTRMESARAAFSRNAPWDVVVIQPWGSDDKEAAKLIEYVKVLQGDIAKFCPNARVVMYMDASGLMERADARTETSVRKKMQTYRELARATGVTVAPAALACLLISKEKPAFYLKYASQPDNVHPGQRGSYAIACSIFTALFDRSPEGLDVRRVEMHYKIGKDGKSHDTRTPSPASDPRAADPKTTEDVHRGEKPVTVLTDEDARLLQQKAWQAWQEWLAFLKQNR